MEKYLFLMVLFLIMMTPSLYWLFEYHQGNLLIDNYLETRGLNQNKLSKNLAMKVSDSIRNDFNTNEKEFKKLKMRNRPFLRNDVNFLLKYKEGLCGEGARVIVLLLNRLGFDARRVTLYNKYLQASHTLVSVKFGNREFLIDSINSSKEENQLLKKYDVSSEDFQIMHYSSNIIKRRQFQPTSGRPELNHFFEHYWIYSYEAIPVTKILTKLGFDVRVFNLMRPPRLVSILAERPMMIKIFTNIVISCVVVISIYM
jgi:hypothetical protein